MQAERIAQARELRSQGKLLKEIAADMGVSFARVHQWLKAELTPCECGCGEQTWTRYVRDHQAFRHAPDYRIDADTGCWEWLGAKDTKGYGQLSRNGRMRRAPRFFFEQANGPIPDGLEIDHLCFNVACVNPEHLEAVTPATNSQRRRNTKLTWGEVHAIRASGLGCCAVARQWSISPAQASKILRNETWRA